MGLEGHSHICSCFGLVDTYTSFQDQQDSIDERDAIHLSHNERNLQGLHSSLLSGFQHSLSWQCHNSFASCLSLHQSTCLFLQDRDFLSLTFSVLYQLTFGHAQYIPVSRLQYLGIHLLFADALLNVVMK